VSRAAGPLCSPRHTTLRRWVLPVRSWLGSTLAVGFYPFVVGSYPSSLGPTLRRWVLPFVVGPYHSSLGPTLHRWVLPFVVGFTPSPFGFTLRCWVLPPEGSGCDHLRVVRHEGGWFEHPHVVQHEGGFVLVGAKAAVRLVSLGVIVVMSSERALVCCHWALLIVLGSSFVVWSSFAVGPTRSPCATPAWSLGLRFVRWSLLVFGLGGGVFVVVHYAGGL